MVLIVIGLLLVIHVSLQFAGPSWQISAQYAFAFIPIRFTANLFPQVQGSAYWSMFTYGLLHADWTHLGFNSLWLLIFSKPVVLRLGSLRYLIILSVSIVGGAVASLIIHWGEFLVMIGISAGVSGIMAAAIPLMYARGGSWAMISSDNMSQLIPLRPVEIITHRTPLVFTVMWLGLTMLTATSQYLTGTAFLEERVVAWEAHVGGFVVGIVLFYLLEWQMHRHRSRLVRL